MGYDLDKDPDQFVLTHARAFQRHPAFQLAAAVDQDASRRTLFEQRFSAPAFATIGDALAAVHADVVALAVPTNLHQRLGEETLALGQPKVLLCEKPLTGTVDGGRALVHESRRRGCSLFVNYMRRAEPAVRELRTRLDSGAIEGPLRGVLWYSKGLYNSASHFVNLGEYLLGPVSSVQRLGSADRASGSDAEPDFQITFRNGDVTCLAAGTRRYFHNTMELIAANGRIRYEAAGALVLWQPTCADSLYPGYAVLGSATERLHGEFQRSQWHVADQIAQFLSGGAASLCTGDEALATLEILSRIEGTP